MYEQDKNVYGEPDGSFKVDLDRWQKILNFHAAKVQGVGEQKGSKHHDSELF
jgi:hypothetical protein